MKVLITSNSFASCDPKAFELLVEAGYEVIPNPCGRLLNEDELIEWIKDVDAVILGTEVLNKNVIDAAKNLKIVSRYGVGLDKVDVEYLKEKGIKLTITQNANTNSVADHAVGLMLASAHSICRSDRNLRNHIWEKPISHDLYQSTVGVIGLGAIGKAVVKRLHGFDCKVLGYDIAYDEEFMKQYKVQASTIDEIFKASDFITLHVPALECFTPLIDKEAISKMKKDVIIVNAARAKLIDRDALVDALDNNDIYAIATDVHYKEPEVDPELLKSQTSVFTPHLAASSYGSINTMSLYAAMNVIDFFKEQN